jgi:hypothetical protein
MVNSWGHEAERGDGCTGPSCIGSYINHVYIIYQVRGRIEYVVLS